MFVLDLRLDGNPTLDADPNCTPQCLVKSTSGRVFFSSFRSTTRLGLFTESLDVRWRFRLQSVQDEKDVFDDKSDVLDLLLATERNQIDEFFTQSSLTAKPVVMTTLIDRRRDQMDSFFSPLATQIGQGYIHANEFKRSNGEWALWNKSRRASLMDRRRTEVLSSLFRQRSCLQNFQ